MASNSQLNDQDYSKRKRIAPTLPTLLLMLKGVLGVLASGSICFAQVQLPTVNLGDTNVEDGFAAPGWFLEEFPDVYIASDFQDSHGTTVPGRNHLNVYSTTTHIAFLGNERFLGGWWAAEVLQPLADAEVETTGGAPFRVRGFGDLLVGPGLQWAPVKIRSGVLAQRVMVDVGVPTGKYSDTRPVNIGNHFVFVNPYYAFTYEQKKVEFSSRLHYLWNGTNDDPFIGFGIRNMQPGQAVHINYAASYAVMKDVRIGFNGYWLQQFTNHQINGKDVPNSKERTIGLGPGIQIAQRGIWFRFNSYMETDVRNRPSGIKVTFRVSKALPGQKAHR